MAHDFAIAPASVGIVVTVTQIGYALGLFFIVLLFVQEPLLRVRAVLAMLIFATFNVLWAPSTPPQPGHNTFQVRSNKPSRDACRKPEITRSSSSPLRLAKSSTLMRLSS